MEQPERDPEPSVAVAVIRTGGFAGLRREWRAEPPADEADHWVGLIERCPWDAADAFDPTSADRFQWCIRAQTGVRRHEAELADRAVTGPWRDLVDEVRRVSGGPTPSPSPGPDPGAGPRQSR